MKTEQERIDYLADRIREFNILVSGQGEISGGFGKLPPRGQGDITIEHIEKAMSEFRLMGNNGIQAHGSLEHGYMLFQQPGGDGATGFAGTTGPAGPPIIITNGACCYPNGNCVIDGNAHCVSSGGTYQGDGTNCGPPNPCGSPTPATGACCNGSDCSITTAAGCAGVYQGDGTFCDPNPCSGACCAGGVCFITSLAECAGHFLGGGTTCAGIDCNYGGCCFPNSCDRSVGCSYTNGVTDELWCVSHGGIYGGDGTDCSGIGSSLCAFACFPYSPATGVLGAFRNCGGAFGCTSASSWEEVCAYGGETVCHDGSGCLHPVSCGDTVYCGSHNPCTYESGAVCSYGIPCCNPDCM